MYGFNKRFQKKKFTKQLALCRGHFLGLTSTAKQISKNIFAWTFFSFRLAEFCTNFHKRGEVCTVTLIQVYGSLVNVTEDFLCKILLQIISPSTICHTHPPERDCRVNDV